MVRCVDKGQALEGLLICLTPSSASRPPLQIAACADVTVVSVADVSAEALEKEKAIEMEKEDIKSKPEAIRWVWVGGQRAEESSIHASVPVLGLQGAADER